MNIDHFDSLVLAWKHLARERDRQMYRLRDMEWGGHASHARILGPSSVFAVMQAIEVQFRARVFARAKVGAA